jgi:dolichyl-phosphate beta-glucosyltransferase
MASPALSVVLPVYDEALVLERTFATLIPFLEELDLPFEVICVDDGSQDDSLAILHRLAENEPRLRVEALPRNRGKGAAVRKGMLLAEGERIVFMDADLSTPLAEFHGFLGALDSDYEVVIGNRRAPGSRITRHQPWIRETLGKGFTILTRLLLAPGVHDFTCGFKAFRREAARKIFERSTLNGWAFDAELVVIAHSLGLKLAQVPVAWHDEEGTKVKIVAAVLGSLRDLLVIRWKRMRGCYR